MVNAKKTERKMKDFWQISIGEIIAAITFVGTILGIVFKFGGDIANIRTRLKKVEDDMKIQQAMNEKTFSKLEDELKHISEMLHKLIGYFEAKQNNIWK